MLQNFLTETPAQQGTSPAVQASKIVKNRAKNLLTQGIASAKILEVLEISPEDLVDVLETQVPTITLKAIGQKRMAEASAAWERLQQLEKLGQQELSVDDKDFLSKVAAGTMVAMKVTYGDLRADSAAQEATDDRERETTATRVVGKALAVVEERLDDDLSPVSLKGALDILRVTGTLDKRDKHGAAQKGGDNITNNTQQIKMIQLNFDREAVSPKGLMLNASGEVLGMQEKDGATTRKSLTRHDLDALVKGQTEGTEVKKDSILAPTDDLSVGEVLTPSSSDLASASTLQPASEEADMPVNLL